MSSQSLCINLNTISYDTDIISLNNDHHDNETHHCNFVSLNPDTETLSQTLRKSSHSENLHCFTTNIASHPSDSQWSLSNLNNNNNESTESHSDRSPQHREESSHENNGYCVANTMNPDPTLGIVVDEVEPPTTTPCDSLISIKFRNKTYVIDTQSQTSRCVINLSSRVLSHDEKNLLSKGLKFCPTPGEPSPYNIHEDLRAFFRRMRLKAHFNDNEDNISLSQSSQPLFSQTIDSQDNVADLKGTLRFKEKSTWEPGEEYRDPVLETFFKSVQDDIGKYIPREPRDKNLSPSEKAAMKSLADDCSITIKKADKGAAVVIMDTEDYIWEAKRQLSDTNYYLPQSEDLTEHHVEKVQDFLLHLRDNGEIDEHLRIILDPAGARTARFYFLPKIHKKDVKGRPIISGNGSPTEKISAFVDDHLRQYVQNLPSFVRDTTDFIKKVEGLETFDNTYLVTMDVSSLYTNIPNHEGITAVHHTVQQNDLGQLNKSSLIELLKLVLHLNNFEFNGEHFLQIGGTSMGSRTAPSYANIFMGNLEKRLLERAPAQPRIYLRYIDDIFMVFDGPEQELIDLIEYFNQSHPTIKFTAEYSKKEVSFLDTWVKIGQNNKIYFDLYTKPTDT